ncbi:hypothetical protein SynSYN20_01606 [Synechococcus sp. SYN20]|nr:hypothetical protein SynSYN20_01606 [Synechococcus sp. SYN20]
MSSTTASALTWPTTSSGRLTSTPDPPGPFVALSYRRHVRSPTLPILSQLSACSVDTTSTKGDT